jgi:hypothetical protein
LAIHDLLDFDIFIIFLPPAHGPIVMICTSCATTPTPAPWISLDIAEPVGDNSPSYGLRGPDPNVSREGHFRMAGGRSPAFYFQDISSSTFFSIFFSAYITVV